MAVTIVLFSSPFHFEARGEWFVWCQTTTQMRHSFVLAHSWIHNPIRRLLSVNRITACQPQISEMVGTSIWDPDVIVDQPQVSSFIGCFFFICSYSVRPCKWHLRRRDYPDIYPVHLLALGELMVKWASVMWSLIMIVLFLFHYLCDIMSCMNNKLWFIHSLLTRMICVSCLKYILNGW